MDKAKQSLIIFYRRMLKTKTGYEKELARRKLLDLLNDKIQGKK